MLNLNAGERGLVLPQHNVPNVVDSPWELLPAGRSGREAGWGSDVGEEGRENCG